jgi:hypothetical protein
VKSLRLKELRIYDDKGVDRVVISGHVPEPLYQGKPDHTSSRAMAGILIYDGDATERGGYGTYDGYANAMLSLDNAKREMVLLMLAEPEGGPFLQGKDGKASIRMGVDGEPFLTLKDDKGVILAKPENNPWVTREAR